MKLANIALIFSTALACLVFSACPGKTPTADSGAPAPTCGAGREAGEIRRYSPDNLFEYNDGGADAFIARGFKSLAVRDCRGPGQALAIAELYDMGAPENARFMFDEDRGNLAANLTLGDQGFFVGDAAFVLKDRRLIRVLTIARGQDPAGNVVEIARATVEALK